MESNEKNCILFFRNELDHRNGFGIPCIVGEWINYLERFSSELKYDGILWPFKKKKDSLMSTLVASFIAKSGATAESVYWTNWLYDRMAVFMRDKDTLFT